MTDDSPDEIAARLPRPREDEPQSLRQDIVDELADHLACSLLRERMRSSEKQPTDSQLWQRVVQRFGSPSQLARQLWFDWMWEKIMMQRITTVLLFVLVLGCGALLYSMNNTLQNSRMHQAVMLQELMQLKALGTPEPVKNQPTEWNNLSVKIVYDDEAKTPVAGAVVKCSGQTEHTKTIPTSQLMSNEQGEVDFGLVLYGQYSISLEVPNGVETKNHIAAVRPGKDELFEVVVPKSATRPVKFTRILPDKALDDSGIQSSRLWYHVHLRLSENVTGRRDNGTVSWNARQSEAAKKQEFFISQDGVIEASKLTAIEPQDRLLGQINSEDQRIHRFSLNRWLIPVDVAPSDTAEVSIGKYSFSEYSVDVYVEMKLEDGRKMLASVPRSPLVPSVLLQATSATPVRIQKSFDRTRKMLTENSLWAYANNWSAGAAPQSAQSSGGSSSMMGSGRGDQHDGMSSYGGGGYGGLGVASPKPTDPLASMLGQFINFYAGASETASSSASYGGGGFFGENVITFSVFPEVASGKHLIEFSTPAAANSFGMINFLDQIDMNDYLITGIVGMPNYVGFEESAKYDIQVTQKDAEGKGQPVTIATNASIMSTQGLRHIQEPDVMSAVCLLSVSKEELLRTLDVLQPIYSEARFPTIMAVPSESDEPTEAAAEAEAN